MILTEKEMIKAHDRLVVLDRIKEYERQGFFDLDVEDDPPSLVLHAKDIHYANRSPWAEIKRNGAFLAARIFFRHALKTKKLFLKQTEGLENLSDLSTGAVITCNHFNPFDRFVMQKVFDASKRRGRMYSVIREGNYTSFRGFYGVLMRNCDTFPLSSELAAMKKLLVAADSVLKEKHCILVYPEQSMWWNYRKPKPLKSGAFDLAVRSGVPVVPCFITLSDSALIGDDGFPVQEYTPHVGKPIYPDLSLGRRAAAEKMAKENYAYCKEIYEKVYGIPLTYTTEK